MQAAIHPYHTRVKSRKQKGGRGLPRQREECRLVSKDRKQYKSARGKTKLLFKWFIKLKLF